MEGFTYIVNPPEEPKVAFGSGLHREALALSGPTVTPFMRRIQGENRVYPGPFEYSACKGLSKSYASKRGFSAFSSKLPRLTTSQSSHFPPIGAYNAYDKMPPKPAFRPFNVGGKRDEIEMFYTPGPASYPIHVRRPKLKVSMGFGSKRIIFPTVTVFCSPFNITKCYKCGKTPFGDYWHNAKSNLDMCRPCMQIVRAKLKKCSTDIFHRIHVLRELENFKPARYCGFFHDHNGTTAATQLISNRTLHFKIEKENYLSLYL